MYFCPVDASGEKRARIRVRATLCPTYVYRKERHVKGPIYNYNTCINWIRDSEWMNVQYFVLHMSTGKKDMLTITSKVIKPRMNMKSRYKLKWDVNGSGFAQQRVPHMDMSTGSHINDPILCFIRYWPVGDTKTSLSWNKSLSYIYHNIPWQQSNFSVWTQNSYNSMEVYIGEYC
jgi:hypothetical protein